MAAAAVLSDIVVKFVAFYAFLFSYRAGDAANHIVILQNRSLAEFVGFRYQRTNARVTTGLGARSISPAFP